MKWRRYLLPAAIFAVLVVFVIYPVLSVLGRSLSVGGKLGLGNYVRVLTEPHLRNTLIGSALLAVSVAAIATLLGLTIAIVVLKTELPFRRLFALAAVMPMIIPGFVASLSYIFLFGRNGLITYKLLGLNLNVYSWRSVLIIQMLDFTTLAFLLISAVLVSADSRLEDAARNLGASEWEVLTTVTLPLTYPGIISALLLIFMRSMADFSTPLLVGGSFSTLASASYMALIGTFNTEMASTLNTILLICSMTVFGAYLRVQAVTGRVRKQDTGAARKPLCLGRPAAAILWTVGALFTTYIFMILISVFMAAFSKHLGANYQFTLEYFRMLPHREWNGVINTISFATVTALIVSFLGVVVAYLVTRIEFKGRGLLDLMATLPFAVPGTFMGVGYVLAFSHAPLVLTGSWLIVVILTVIRELPIGIRSGVSVLTQQDDTIEDASTSLGASKLTTFFRIIIPAARPALLVSALYAFVATVKTIGAVIFVITPGTKLLSIDVFEAVVKGGIGNAASLSVVMLLLSAMGMGMIFLLNRRGAGERWLKPGLVYDVHGS
ncbi:MAG: iron ABC transporter permease [Chloroflexota bacterium]